VSDSERPEFTVPPALDGQRLDRAVALVMDWTRTEVGRLCDAGSILVGGDPAPKSRRLSTGDVIELLADPPIAARPAPGPVPLDVRYTDDDLVVISKPAGLVVHPGSGHQSGTLVNGLLAAFPEVADVGDPDRPGIVHRLDRDTSGLMLVARSGRAYDALVAALADRDVERVYTALVWGAPNAPRGIVDAPIGRSTSRRTRMAVRESGKSARTTYEVRRRWDDPAVSLLECRLETGRTHQIRVHLSAIGHPVVGDGAYGGRRQPLALPRPFLHAGRLALRHPVTGADLSFDDPLPDALTGVLDQLGAPSAAGG
jgi:23S rRNA pseudouridine1911/1915/1917 synthase